MIYVLIRCCIQIILALLMSYKCIAQWIALNSGTKATLYSTFFTSENTGWVVGDSGKILKTTDGGDSWISQYNGSSKFLGSVYFINTNVGWVVGQEGLILKTTNGGNNWSTQTSGTLLFLNSVCFSSQNNGWIVGYNWMGGPAGTYVVLKTTNGGNNWVTLTNVTFNLWSSAYFISDTKGWIVGGTLVGGLIGKTTDAGLNWTYQVVSPGLTSIFFKTENKGWAVGPRGLIVKTIDGGSTWDIVSSGTSNNLYSVNFTTEYTGWVTGDSGLILKTTDGGNTWLKEASGTASDLFSIYFPTQSTGYAVGMDGTIVKTTSGGNVLSSPDLVSPPNESTIQSSSVTLEWSDVIGATSYHVQVSRDQSFTSLVSDASSLSTSHYTIGGLDAQTTYYWRVNATDGITTSSWSDIWKFTVSPLLQLTVTSSPYTLSLNLGEPYMFTFLVRSNNIPVSNASVNITDQINGKNIELNTNHKGECFYHSFVPYNTTIGSYSISIFAIKDGYISSPSLSKTISVTNSAYLIGDETNNMGICPTVISTGNGNNILNFSREGKLVAYYTPTVGSWNIIPYTTSTDIHNNQNMPLYGSPGYEGLFGGLDIDGNFIWLWQIPNPIISHPNPDDPTVKIEYEIPFEFGKIRIELTCICGNPNSNKNASLQSYKIINETGQSREIKFIYYGFIHPNIKNQQPPLGTMGISLFAGWKHEAPIFTQVDVIDNTVRIQPGISERGQFVVVGVTIDNSANLLNIDSCKVSAFNLSNPSGVYDSNRIDFNSTSTSSVNDKVNWALCYDLGIIQTTPNNTKTVNVFIASDIQSINNAIQKLNNAKLNGAISFINSSNDWWHSQSFIRTIEGINSLSDNIEKPLLKRWAITCRMLVDNDSGSIIASPNRQPKYFPVWVRDGIFQSLFWEALNEREIVNRFIIFLRHIIENEGEKSYWKQCYSIMPNPSDVLNPTDRYQGLPLLQAIEEDQMGEFLWALYVIAQHRGITEFPEYVISRDQISRIANWIVSRIVNKNDIDLIKGKKEGLLQPSLDWYEFPENDGTIEDIRYAFGHSERAAIEQSILTNAAAVRGLQSASYFTRNSSFSINADIIRDKLFSNYFYRTDLNTLTPPAYVALSNIDLIPSPIPPYLWPIVISEFTQSTRDEIVANQFSSVWPFKVYSYTDAVITNFRITVNSLLDQIMSSKKIFTPQYLLLACSEIYQSNDDKKIQNTIKAIKGNPKTSNIGYVPENLLKRDGIYIGQGAAPLGWANAWAGLALLAKGGIKLRELDISSGSATKQTDNKLDNNNVFFYPNPVNIDLQSCNFVFGLGKPGDVKIKIYDISNTLVKTIDAGNFNQGSSYEVSWDGRNGNGQIVANGIYYFVIESSSGERGVGKIAVLR